MTLIEFLLARIAEDEERADRVEFHPYVGEGVPQSLRVRVLAEVAAKRAIVEGAVNYSPELEHGDNGEWALEMTLQALASVYADHPDYRNEWKP